MSRLSWFQTSHGAAKSLEINDPAMIYIRKMLEHADRPYDLLPPHLKTPAFFYSYR
ncbi:hypothetical protein [Pseudomonas sp. S2_A10]